MTPTSDRVALLRRRIQLDAPLSRAPARVFAESRYVLSVNGREAGRGPVRAQPQRRLADCIDLSPLLRVGTNDIALLVRHYGEPTPWWMPGPDDPAGPVAWFSAELGDDVVLTIDAAWVGIVCDAWTPQRPRGIGAGVAEQLDARRLDPGWTTSDPAALGWPVWPEPPTTTVLSSLRDAPLPHPVGATIAARPIGTAIVPSAPDDPDPQDPVKRFDAVAQHGTDALAPPDPAVPVVLSGTDTLLVTYDLGATTCGVLSLDLDVPRDTVVDLVVAEEVHEDGRVRRGEQRTGIGYTARGEHDRLTSIERVGGRYIGVALRPGAAGSVHLPAVRVEERLHPHPAGASFSCSDPRLDTIYDIGIRTVSLCSLDAYVDCPTREQRAWSGDAVVHQMVDLATNPDWTLAIHHPWLAATPRADGMLPMAAAGDIEARFRRAGGGPGDGVFIPDWALHWVRSVHNLMRWTGDRELVGELLPVVEGVLRWFAPSVGEDGLLHDVPGWVLIDWSTVHSAGTSAALNGLWARALRDGIELASWLGAASLAGWARSAWTSVRDGFGQFWQPDRNAYADRLLRDGTRTFSQHATASAIAGGLVPADRLAPAVELLTDRSRLLRHSFVMDAVAAGAPIASVLLAPYPEPDWDTEARVIEAQPFFRYVVHDALVAAGRADLVAELCLDWMEVVERGETCWPETWYAGTHCHGWSSTPSRDLPTAVLGVRPVAPGCAEMLVAPRLGSLEWAEGRLPTPHGFVHVRVDADRVIVDSPVPVRVDVTGHPVRPLPAGRHAVVG